MAFSAEFSTPLGDAGFGYAIFCSDAVVSTSLKYYRYTDTVQGKSFLGVGNNFVHALFSEIENKEEYEFLKGNKELETIFEEYLK